MPAARSSGDETEQRLRAVVEESFGRLATAFADVDRPRSD